MKVLIIKMSSLGDVLHTFPALMDAGLAIPGVEFDWVVEENFVDLPRKHPLVNEVIPIAFRRLRKKPFTLFFNKEWRAFKKKLQATEYDLIIDAQGLLKSAFITFFARGKKAGLDKASLWEPMARFAYQSHCSVDPRLHAVARVRQLFAQALNYDLPNAKPNYGLRREAFMPKNGAGDYVLFLHGTTWVTKQWPVSYWFQLANQLSSINVTVNIPWGSVQEKEDAEFISKGNRLAVVLPEMSLAQMITMVAGAKAIVAVDTGLAHIAAALGVPTISLYGPTDPGKTGAMGDNQIQLSAKFECAPCLQRVCTYKKTSDQQPACFTRLPPQMVFEKLKSIC